MNSTHNRLQLCTTCAWVRGRGEGGGEGEWREGEWREGGREGSEGKREGE